MNQDYNQRLDEIFYQYRDEYNAWQANPRGSGTNGIKLQNRAKQAILSDLLEIIGEDKKPFNTNFNRGIKPDIITKIENQLRQELREKVRKYCE